MGAYRSTIEDGQTVEAGSCIGMVRPQRLFTDHQGPFAQRDGFGIASLLIELDNFPIQRCPVTAKDRVFCHGVTPLPKPMPDQFPLHLCRAGTFKCLKSQETASMRHVPQPTVHPFQYTNEG